MCRDTPANNAEGTWQCSDKIAWPLPSALEGVKSQKRLFFEVDGALVETGYTSIKVRNLALSLSSRVLAVGEEGRRAADLLVDSSNPLATSHEGLKVLRLEATQFPCAESTSDYAKAISSALVEQHPHVVVLSEEGLSQNAAWKSLFDSIVHGKSIWEFRGAVVICAAVETDVLQERCSERWIADMGGVSQRACFRVTEDAMLAGVEELYADAAQIAYCDLSYWIKRAQAEDFKVTRFDAGGCDGPGRLRGLIFHQMIEGSAEFHVRFVFVPKEHRKGGNGSTIVRWVIERASLMPLSECRWISLECADDELLPWYEKFGFMDMSCGHTEGDGGQTHMELQNVPKQ